MSSDRLTTTLRSASNRLQSALGFHPKYFVHGLARIVAVCVVAVLSIICFNVIGYILVTHGLSIFGSHFPVAESYLGRVLLLAFIGIMDSGAAGLAVYLAAAAFYFACQGIQRIGGQPSRKNASRKRIYR